MGLQRRSIGEGGAIAQLVERVLCKHEVVGSIPSGSTSLRAEGVRAQAGFSVCNRRGDHKRNIRNSQDVPMIGAWRA
jgi:hypothetical protein